MSEEEIIETLKLFENERIENLQKNSQELFYAIMKIADQRDRLLHIAKKMHLWIFLNTDDEQEIYDELGLTEEDNILLGYSGQIILDDIDKKKG